MMFLDPRKVSTGKFINFTLHISIVPKHKIFHAHLEVGCRSRHPQNGGVNGSLGIDPLDKSTSAASTSFELHPGLRGLLD